MGLSGQIVGIPRILLVVCVLASISQSDSPVTFWVISGLYTPEMI
jgi:hypothetical protein